MENIKRRNFIKWSTFTGLATAVIPKSYGATLNYPTSVDDSKIKVPTGIEDRKFWVSLLQKIATPVLNNLSEGKLKVNMPLEVSSAWDNLGRDKSAGYLEAFARLLAGMAPWLAVEAIDLEEERLRKDFLKKVQLCIINCVNPQSPDYFLWKADFEPTDKRCQPLVDSAYLAQAFIKAPKVLWAPLPATTKQQVIKEFTKLRSLIPPFNNWLLFSAMIETFFSTIGEVYDALRINMAIHKIQEWYVGDGWYSDGTRFHFDYYNSFVIHPMLHDIMAVMVKKNQVSKEDQEQALLRMQRYGDILERFISPEGTYPAFGRSITYRVGVFQALSMLSLENKLPEHIAPAQVRCALTAVMKRMFSHQDIFDKNGWLTLGYAGHQPNVAEGYSNTGSMYMTSLAFLPLGLPANDAFWTSPYTEWSSAKAWSGKPFPQDHAVGY
jgi:hypothetical protein